MTPNHPLQRTRQPAAAPLNFRGLPDSGRPLSSPLGPGPLRLGEHAQLAEKNIVQEVDAPPLDLIVFQVIHDAEGHAEILLSRGNARVLADMLANHVGLDHGLAIANDRIGGFRSGIKRNVIESLEHLSDGVRSPKFHIGSH